MKTKITLILVLFFIFFKIQAQVPSINEKKSSSVVNDSFIVDYQKSVIDDQIKKIEDEKKGIDTKNQTEISKKDTEIETLNQNKKDLENNVKSEVYKAYYEKIIREKQVAIDDYIKVLKGRNQLDLKGIDSVYNLIDEKKHEIELLIEERNEKLALLGKFPWYLPSWKKANREKFFYDMYSNKTDKTILLNSFALTSNSDATAVQTEIVTDNMWALRISFGSVLSVSSGKKTDETTEETPEEQTKKETEEEAFSRLINGGGNFYLDLILPLLTTNQNNGDQITFYSYANLRGAMDIKNFNSNVDTSTGNGTLGLNAYLGLSSDSKKFNFFLQGNMNYTVGTNDFYRNLGLNEEKAFLNGKIIAGVTILNNFRFSAIINAFGSDEKIRSNKVVVGIQILPGL